MSEFEGTIEEIAETFAENFKLDAHEVLPFINGFIQCHKWQQQQINCELLELLEQRNEMLAMLEDIVNLFKRGEFDTDENIGGRQLIKAKQLIKKVKDNE